VAVARALAALQPHRDRGLVEVTAGVGPAPTRPRVRSGRRLRRRGATGGRLRLTSPEGFLFSNTVLVSLFE